MKYLFLALLLLPAIAISKGPERKFDIERTVELPNVSKDELYDRALLWLTKSFRSANDAIQMKDKEAGRIICQASIPYAAPAFAPGTNYSGHFSFTLTYECKEGKYRYRIENAKHESSLVGYSIGFLNAPARNKKTIISQAERDFTWFSESFEAGMKQSSKTDW